MSGDGGQPDEPGHWAGVRDRLHDQIEAARLCGAPRDEIGLLYRAECNAMQMYYRCLHEQRRRDTMDEPQTVTIYTAKGAFAKWSHTLPEGTYSGLELYRAFGAPLWGSMALKRPDGTFLPIERNDTYTIPDDIPAGATLTSNW